MEKDVPSTPGPPTIHGPKSSTDHSPGVQTKDKDNTELRQGPTTTTPIGPSLQGPHTPQGPPSPQGPLGSPMKEPKVVFGSTDICYRQTRTINQALMQRQLKPKTEGRGPRPPPKKERKTNTPKVEKGSKTINRTPTHKTSKGGKPLASTNVTGGGPPPSRKGAPNFTTGTIDTK